MANLRKLSYQKEKTKLFSKGKKLTKKVKKFYKYKKRLLSIKKRKRKLRKKRIVFLRKHLRYKLYRPFSSLPFYFRKKKKKLFLTITIKSNNIFCNLKNFSTNRTFKFCSAGKYKIKVTRKSLRYMFKPTLELFFREIKKIIRKFFLCVIVLAPLRFRKQILKFLHFKFLKMKKRCIVKIKEKKCFNGCSVKKKRRKKRKGLRIFKL